MTVRRFPFQTSASARAWLVALSYAAIGLAVYWPALGAPLLSDDYYFLGLVAPASNVLVVFEPLLDRFWRPLVVAMYYACYHAGGLWPWPYHLLTLLPHVAAAWLLYRSLALIDPGGPVRAYFAGLLFLVFAGHSEAVAWPAGVADPAMAAALTGALYCYLRALAPGASRGWLAAFFGAIVLAALAKEAWVVLPGILLAHLVALGPPGAAVRRRAAVALGGAVLCVLAYLLMRRLVFGNVAGGYAVLSSSMAEGAWPGQLRAFMLRLFAPAGHYVANLWLSGRDVLIWPVAFVALALTARGRTLRILIFAALATGAALVPVLPLSISVSSTESERYVYLATVFSSIFVVWAVEAVVRARALVAAVSLILVTAHAVSLVRINGRWHEAGALAQRIVHGVADRAREHDPGDQSAIFLLGVADNIGGPFVFRVGLYPALRLNRPERAHQTGRTVVVATAGYREASDAVAVARAGSRAFHVDFGRNGIVQPVIPSTVQYEIRDKTDRAYTIEFSDTIDRAVVLYQSGGGVELAGVVEGAGLPFGVVDLPPAGEPVMCQGESVRFAGWALDGDGLPRVRLHAPDLGRDLGEGIPRPGMRPDVAAQYPGYPGVDRGGWDVELPCALVVATGASGGTLRVQVVAEDPGGLRRVLGERTVTTR